jgi:hypothetical protein
MCEHVREMCELSSLNDCLGFLAFSDNATALCNHLVGVGLPVALKDRNDLPLFGDDTILIGNEALFPGHWRSPLRQDAALIRSLAIKPPILWLRNQHICLSASLIGLGNVEF